MNRYLTLAAHVRHVLEQAITAAGVQLPYECMRQHHIEQKRQSRRPWESVRLEYQRHEDEDPAITRILIDLQALAEALGSVNLVLREEPTNPPDLTLAKTRSRF